MKWLAPIVIIFLLSCQPKYVSLPSNLMNGEWRYDSSDAGLPKWYFDFIIIPDDSIFWKFSLNRNPYTIDSCCIKKDDSVYKNGKSQYHLQLLDSNKLLVFDANHNKFYYSRSRVDPGGELTYFLSSDSMRALLTGWWRTTRKKDNYGIQLPNCSGCWVVDYTLHLDTNRTATYYINNLRDSVEQFEWEGAPDGFTIGRGCIQDYPITTISLTTNEMTIMMPQSNDTFELLRTIPIADH